VNKLVAGTALVLLLGGSGSSAHAQGSWCAFYDVSTFNCGFHSYEQCYQNIFGVGGSCRPNFFQSYGNSRPSEKKARGKRPG
jgi:hypothetical protein